MNTYKKTAHLANIWFDGPIISTSTYRQFFVVVASSQNSNKLVVEVEISILSTHTESCCTSCPELLILPLPHLFFFFLFKNTILFK